MARQRVDREDDGVRDLEARPVDREKISVANQAINEFFKSKEKNSKRVEWVNPKKERIPEALREIYSSMRLFFKGKRWYNGGPIPDELLYTKNNFHLLNNVALIDAIDLAYDSIAMQKSLARTPYKKDVEIAITLRVIRDCEKKKDIPQEHIAGLLLLYLELCEKVVLL